MQLLETHRDRLVTLKEEVATRQCRAYKCWDKKKLAVQIMVDIGARIVMHLMKAGAVRKRTRPLPGYLETIIASAPEGK